MPSGDCWISAKNLNQTHKKSYLPKARNCSELIVKNIVLFHHLVKEIETL
jgi:hypothetical protein